MKVWVRYLEKSNIDLLREIAEPYGIEIKRCNPGEGGIFVDGRKLSEEEIKDIIYGVFITAGEESFKEK